MGQSAEEGYFDVPRLTDDLYLPPVATDFRFYDLGVVKNEGGQWVYTFRTLDPTTFPGWTGPLDPTTPEQMETLARGLTEAWNEALLADLDPDNWPTFLPLTTGAENLLVDVVFTYEGEEERDDLRYIVGEGDKRAYLIDYPESFEGGSPPARDNDEWTGKRLAPKLKGGQWGLRVEAGWLYAPFSTAAHMVKSYKVTEEADPQADEVALTFRKGDKVEVYLTPKVTSVGGALINDVLTETRIMRIPTLPISIYSEPTQDFMHARPAWEVDFIHTSYEGGISVRANEALWLAYFAFAQEVGVPAAPHHAGPDVNELRGISDWLHGIGAVGGVLPIVALIRRNKKLYYLWGRYDYIIDEPQTFPAYGQVTLRNPVVT